MIGTPYVVPRKRRGIGRFAVRLVAVAILLTVVLVGGSALAARVVGAI